MSKFKCNHCKGRFSREGFAFHLKRTYGGTTCLKTNKVNSSKREIMDTSITEPDIEVFYAAGTRSTNDEINKKREKIICALGNNDLPNEWIENNSRWKNLFDKICEFVNGLIDQEYISCFFKHQGGRSKHNDINIIFTLYDSSKIIKKIEFKYGANEINDCPQWVSPMKPSQYFNKSYEGLFYDEYLPVMAEKYGLDIPERDVYLREIHGNKPECTRVFKEKYDRGNKNTRNPTPLYTGEQSDIDNYNFAKNLNNESIKNFLETAVFNVEKMNEYLRETQKDKIYLLWNEGSFNIRTRNEEDYQINSQPLIIKNNNCLLGKTLSNYPIKILLRWKNGVAFPALQIS